MLKNWVWKSVHIQVCTVLFWNQCECKKTPCALTATVQKTNLWVLIIICMTKPIVWKTLTVLRKSAHCLWNDIRHNQSGTPLAKLSIKWTKPIHNLLKKCYWGGTFKVATKPIAAQKHSAELNTCPVKLLGQKGQTIKLSEFKYIKENYMKKCIHF